MEKRICYLPAHNDGCALWRMLMPHVNTKDSGFFYFTTHVDWGKVSTYDAVVVQRLLSLENLNFVNSCHKMGIKVIYDIDDAMGDIPVENPAYHQLQDYMHGFGVCMAASDHVTVSTQPLKRKMERLLQKHGNTRTEVQVVANKIEPTLFPRTEYKKHNRIGWSGSGTHAGDFPVALPALKMALEYDCDIVFNGSHPDVDFLKNNHKVHIRPWVIPPQFGSCNSNNGVDIALAPLADNEFNRAKSNIKMIEAGWNGIPCLASWVAPYDYFTSFNPELRWLLCTTESQWASKLRILMNDHLIKQHYGKLAQDVVEKHFTHLSESDYTEIAKCL